jgi:hypothetical protein
MKKFFLISVLLIASQHFYAQDTNTAQTPRQKDFSFIPRFRAYAFYPIQFGNNAMNEAYKSTVAPGFTISFIRYKNFRFLLGYERAIYRVSDASKIGEMSRSTYHSFQFGFSYTVGNENGFSVSPAIGIGPGLLHLSTGHDRYGSQDAFDARAGFTADYSLDKHFALSLGVYYKYSKINVDTTPEFADYFANSHQIQLSLGFIIK